MLDARKRNIRSFSDLNNFSNNSLTTFFYEITILVDKLAIFMSARCEATIEMFFLFYYFFNEQNKGVHNFRSGPRIYCTCPRAREIKTDRPFRLASSFVRRRAASKSRKISFVTGPGFRSSHLRRGNSSSRTTRSGRREVGAGRRTFVAHRGPQIAGSSRSLESRPPLAGTGNYRGGRG